MLCLNLLKQCSKETVRCICCCFVEATTNLKVRGRRWQSTGVHFLHFSRWISGKLSNDLNLQCRDALFVKVTCYYNGGEMWVVTMSCTISSGTRIVYRISVWRPVVRWPFGRFRSWNYNIKVDHMQLWCSLVFYVLFLV